MQYLHRLDPVEGIGDPMIVDPLQRQVGIFDLVLNGQVEDDVQRHRHLLLQDLCFSHAHRGAIDIFPPGIVRSSLIVPFVDVDGITAQTFDAILDVLLQTADRG